MTEWLLLTVNSSPSHVCEQLAALADLRDLAQVPVSERTRHWVCRCQQAAISSLQPFLQKASMARRHKFPLFGTPFCVFPVTSEPDLSSVPRKSIWRIGE